MSAASDTETCHDTASPFSAVATLETAVVETRVSPGAPVQTTVVPGEVPSRPAAGKSRLAFVDGLRGLAALLVALHHIDRYGPLTESASSLIPLPLKTVFLKGWIGVQIFFVISGFVIAYSLLGSSLTGRSGWSFSLRRLLRLAPPYWVTVILALAASTLAVRGFGFPPLLDDPITAKGFWAHMFYLHKVFDLESYSAGFWTLCIEVQFYLLFVGMLWLAQRKLFGQRDTGTAAPTVGLVAVFLPLSLASLFWIRESGDYDFTVLHFLSMFTLGSLACWVVYARLAPAWFWGFAAVLGARLLVRFELDLCVALLAGLAVYVAGRSGQMGQWLNIGWVQYLGRISYSLYLIHYTVSHFVVHAGHRVTGEHPYAAVGWELLALALSVAVAHLMYHFIEQPSMVLAQRFKTPALRTTTV